MSKYVYNLSSYINMPWHIDEEPYPFNEKIMDPISQGLIGATLPQTVSKKENLLIVDVLGWFAGMAPDLDIFIRSSEDPLLFLQYHRQFTHSLFFIPVGSLLCAVVFHPLLVKKRGLSFKFTWLYCLLGFATHALLDACTSYGTQLLWPFSDTRYAWNLVSVVDPMFTLVIFICFVLNAVWRSPWIARAACLWVLVYLCVAMVQKDRAESVGRQLAQDRNQALIRLEVKPSFANILLWKIICETEESYFIDAVRLGSSSKIYSGASIAKLDMARDFPSLAEKSQQAKDIERFRHFSDGFLARDPEDEQQIIDVRYSIVPNQPKALWGIRVSPVAASDRHVEYFTNREKDPKLRKTFFDMLFDF